MLNKSVDLVILGEYPYCVLKYDSTKQHVLKFLDKELPNLRALGITDSITKNSIWTIQRNAKIAAQNAINAGLTVEWF